MEVSYKSLEFVVVIDVHELIITIERASSEEKCGL
jgi:hypothetical protein